MPDVSFPLLRTKLQRPLPAPSLVPRQRLLDKLLDRPDATLVLIAAPAGSGKTTLAVQWLEHVSWPVAWLSLDEADNDLAVFLSYLVAAIHTACPGACAETERLLHAFQMPPADFLSATLVNELLVVAQPFVLVLDDYHYIHEPSIHHLLGQMLRHAPPSLHLVITSRFDPPLPLNRLASRSKLLEIRAADLRFRSAEAQALLGQVFGVPLPDQSIGQLIEDFDGWAVGLRSLALSLRQGDATGGRAVDLLAGDRRRLISILADEVYAMQPAGVRDFLMRTALVNQMTAPLCQVLLAQDEPGAAAKPDSQAMLERLERDGLFVETLDQEHRWYRYHTLFRAFLTHKLEQTCSAAEVAALHRRAGAWYWQQGSADEAIRHALAAQDASLAADIVAANLYEVLDREEWPTLERWLKQLPGQAIQSRPLLLLAQAWVLFFQLKLQAIPPLLAQAESLLGKETATAPADSSVRCDLETLHALVFLAAGDFSHAVQSAQRALRNVAPGRAFGRGIAVFLQGMALYALRGEEQAIAFCVAISDNPLENTVVRARALESLCHIFGIVCRPIEQERAARALLKLAQEHRLDVSVAWAHRHLGSTHYERHELEKAVQHFSVGVDQRYLAHFTCARDCFVGLALAYQAQGRQEDAQAAASALQAFYVERGLASLPEFDSFQARLALLQGDGQRALQTLTRSQPARAALVTGAYETATLTQAMVQVMAGAEAQRRGALATLDELQRLAEASHSTWYLIRVLALQAIALHQAGQSEDAFARLQRAVTLGSPGRVVGSLAELGQPFRRLLQQWAPRGIERAYVRDLLAAVPDEPSERGAGAALPGAGLVEPLTGRETEVLVLLSRRLGNKEIAASLVVSPLTVKRHMTNIMQKLGVRSRWEAVERGREIGLLPTPRSPSDPNS